MHYAAASGHLSVLRLLLHHGANIEIRDGAGHTPLYWAVFGGHLGTPDLDDSITRVSSYSLVVVVVVDVWQMWPSIS